MISPNDLETLKTLLEETMGYDFYYRGDNKNASFTKLAEAVGAHFQDREGELKNRCDLAMGKLAVTMLANNGEGFDLLMKQRDQISDLEGRVEKYRRNLAHEEAISKQEILEYKARIAVLEAAQSGNGFELLFAQAERIGELESDNTALEKLRDSFESGTLMGIQRFSAAERRVKELEAELEAAQSGDGFKMIFEMREKIGELERRVENYRRHLAHEEAISKHDILEYKAQIAALTAELAAAKAQPSTVQQWCIFNHGCSQGCGTKDPVFFCGTSEQAETLSEEMTQAEDCYDSTWWIIAIPDAPPASPPKGGE